MVSIKKKLFLYFLVYVIFSSLFIAILYKPIINSFFEDDIMYTVPAIMQLTENKNFFKSILILFDPRLRNLEVGLVNVYTYIIVSFFGLQARYFIFGSMLVHISNSILLFLLLKNLDLEFKICFFSSLMYLTFFAHFAAYMLPANVQQLFIIFFLLLVLIFYIKTTALIDTKKNYYFHPHTQESPAFQSGNEVACRNSSSRKPRSEERGVGVYYILTLSSNLVASLNRGPIILLPLLIFIHTLYCAKNKGDRFRKFNLWLPLFAIYLFYLPLRFVFGDSRFSIFEFLPGFLNTKPIIYIYLVLFFSGTLFLSLCWIILKIFSERDFKMPGFKCLVLSIIILGGVVVIASLTKLINIGKLLTMPYKVLFLLAGLQNTFFNPLRTWIDTTVKGGMIDLRITAISVFLAFILIAITVRKAVISKNKPLVIFAFWYLACLLNPAGRPGINYTVIPSHYLIYTSLVFCFVFCASLIELWTIFFKKLKLNILMQESILMLIYMCLLVPNIAAIKLAIFQNKLANNFLNYDYIRMSQIIKNALESELVHQGFKAKNIYIQNVKPPPFAKHDIFPPYNGFNYDIPRHIFIQAFNNKALIDMKINQSPAKENALSYRIEYQFIFNVKGINIDNFSLYFNRGIELFNLHKYKEARELFRKALEARPFLINFMLGNFPIEDIFWITGERDLLTWANQIPGPYDFFRQYKDKNEKFEDKKLGYIISLVDNEINDYARCFFYLSYLEYINKNIVESRLLFSKIKYLNHKFVAPEFFVKQISNSEQERQELQLFLNELNIFKETRRINVNKSGYFNFLYKLLIFN